MKYPSLAPVVALTVLVLTIACNSSNDDGPLVCNKFREEYNHITCQSGSKCCTVSFENEACWPEDVPCPNSCGYWSSCPYDQVCVQNDLNSDVMCADACPADTAPCDLHDCCGPDLFCVHIDDTRGYCSRECTSGGTVCGAGHCCDTGLFCVDGVCQQGSGIDAGTSVDAGELGDGGAAIDAGDSVDAGMTVDAGESDAARAP